ncbi:MAG: hypothetical protein ACHQNT_05900 [Bacteroidia bacterium]
MQPALLELHLAQLNKVWEKSKYNKYSDHKKEQYHTNLGRLIGALNQERFDTLKAAQIIEHKRVLDFIFKSLEFLDKSTFNQIPFEIVYCLKSALNEWLNKTDDFIIVTSLVNGIVEFSFDPSLVVYTDYYKIINSTYNIDFTSKLIQINLPVYLARDYLANVVLYHELGHFIDIKYQITEAIYNEILANYYHKKNLKDFEEKDLLHFFPYLNDPIYIDAFKKGFRLYIFKDHIAEYFCDIFASQYIEKCSGFYLDYLTERKSDYASTHPSTTNRNEIVDKFLNKDSSSYFLNILMDAVEKITGKRFELRFEKYKKNDLKELIPVEIDNEKQLHYLFVDGWNIWLNDWSEIKKINNFQFELSQRKVYEFINNLIEKSIGNFIITKDWEESKKNVPGKK